MKHYINRLVSSRFAVSVGMQVRRMAHMFDMRCCASESVTPSGGGNMAANDRLLYVSFAFGFGAINFKPI